MRVSGKNLNKKEENRFQTGTPDFRREVYQQPIVVKKSYTGIIIASVVLAVVGIPLCLLMIGIVGVVAVPNLVASRNAANEASAISHLRTFHTAQVTYQATSGAGRFGSFDDLVKTNLIAEQPRGYGYEYQLTRSANGNRYCIAANSAAPNPPNKQRSFAVSNEGVIYSSETGAIACENGELGGNIVKALQ